VTDADDVAQAVRSASLLPGLVHPMPRGHPQLKWRCLRRFVLDTSQANDYRVVDKAISLSSVAAA
jgi:hypothetical protein